MADRGFLMIFKYFVEFDDDGEIKALHKCKIKGAREYIGGSAPKPPPKKKQSKPPSRIKIWMLFNMRGFNLAGA